MNKLINRNGMSGLERSSRRSTEPLPGFAKAVVQQEMATAMTMRRYLNTPEGALYGFAPEPPAGIPRIGTEKAVTTIVPGIVAGIELRRFRWLHRRHHDRRAGGAGSTEAGQ